MRELGWREGENVRFYKPFGTGDVAILPRVATELVALHPDVLIGVGSTEAKALQSATKDIPVVFLHSSDPVGSGIVDSISNPGRNATGMSLAPEILWGKRLELVV